MRAAAVLFGFCLILPSCAKAEETIIIFDDWWSVDYAKGLCNEAKHWMDRIGDGLHAARCEEIVNCTFYLPISSACGEGDIAGEVHSYDDELTSRMASNPRCEGISILQYGGPKTSVGKAVSDAMKTPHWTLSFNYVPGAKTQKWDMIHSITGVYAKGEGDPNEIATNVCIAARGRGANILTRALPW